jgi:hypothetical protein
LVSHDSHTTEDHAVTAWFAISTPSISASLAAVSVTGEVVRLLEPTQVIQETVGGRACSDLVEGDFIPGLGMLRDGFQVVPSLQPGLTRQDDALQLSSGPAWSEMSSREAVAFSVQGNRTAGEEHRDRLLRSGGISSFSSGVPPPHPEHRTRRSFRTGPDCIRQSSLQGYSRTARMRLQVQAMWTIRSPIAGAYRLSRDPPDERAKVFSTGSIPSQRGA